MALAKEITDKYSNNYDKVRAVHEWLASHIYYDYDAFFTGNIAATYQSIDVLRNKKAICQGYANLAAALLRSIRIPCRVVTGMGLGLSTNGKWDFQNLEKRTNHAWNEAYVSGRWILMDATWDCDLSCLNGQYYDSFGLKRYRYFDPTIEAFSLDHKLTPENIAGWERTENLKEDYIWKYIAATNTLEAYRFYKQQYPDGRYSDQCAANMNRQLKMIYEKSLPKPR